MSIYLSLNYKKPKSQYLLNEDVPIVLFYYFKGRKLKLSTGVSIKLKDWNGNVDNPVKRSDSDYKVKNLKLKQLIVNVEKSIQRIVLNEQIPDVRLLRIYLKELQTNKEISTKKDFDYFLLRKEYDKVVLSDVRNTLTYRKSVIVSLNQISDFIKNHKKETFFRVDDFNKDIQTEYLNYSVNEKNRSNTTIKKHLKQLRSFIKWCYENSFTEKPLSPIQIQTNFDRDVIYLKRDEILKLYQFDKFDYTNSEHEKYTNEYFTDYLKNNKTCTYTNLEVYKDMLIFGCGLGCRFSDLVGLKVDNYEFDEDDRTKGYFVFRMKKSRIGKKVKIPINQLTFNVWRKYSKNKTRYDYIFPRTPRGNSISNQKMNKHLKVIGKDVELNRWVNYPTYTTDGKVKDGTDIRQPLYKFLTTHIIRRTFIREGINNNIPYHVIMSMSGHSDPKVFQGYFTTTEDELDSSGKKMFSLSLEEHKPSTKKQSKSEPNQNDNDNLKNKLSELKSLYEEGLLPKEVYYKKVNELI